VLFIDARKLGYLVDRTRREFTEDEIAQIAATYHAWRGEPGAEDYEDVPGFCNAVSIDQIREHHHVLTPGRYVGAEEPEEDDVDFVEKFAALKERLDSQFAEADKLKLKIQNNLENIRTND
jgi:type I restriction enzyme M protein